MTTEKQIQANRENAKKSTGPRTQRGKAHSRFNSRKHGLTAKTLIIVGECADDFEALRAELVEEYDPQSHLEIELVERLAGILWRLRRVPLFEAAIVDARHAGLERRQLNRIYGSSEDSDDDDEQDSEGGTKEDEEVSDWKASVHLGQALVNDAASGDALGKLARHETMLMNAFNKTLQAILVLQEKRSETDIQRVNLEAIALQPAA
jgi:hypothetical protein